MMSCKSLEQKELFNIKHFQHFCVTCYYALKVPGSTDGCPLFN